VNALDRLLSVGRLAISSQLLGWDKGLVTSQQGSSSERPSCGPAPPSGLTGPAEWFLVLLEVETLGVARSLGWNCFDVVVCS
jgi:hypothetical protein